MKRRLPIVIALVIFAALGVTVAALIKGSKDDDYYVVLAARRIVAERLTKEKLQEDVDFKISIVAVLSREADRATVKVQALRNPGSEDFYLDLERRDGEWLLRHDLKQHFAEFIQMPGRQDAMRLRFQAAVKERYPAAVELTGTTFRFLVSEARGAIEANTDLTFAAGPIHGRYVETWRWRSGDWAVDGQGRIFEAVR